LGIIYIIIWNSDFVQASCRAFPCCGYLPRWKANLAFPGDGGLQAEQPTIKFTSAPISLKMVGDHSLLTPTMMMYVSMVKANSRGLFESRGESKISQKDDFNETGD
jgi:hypothetical protein